MKVKYTINGRTVTEGEFVKGANGIRDILETRQFPGLQTDDEFMANRGSLADQLKHQTEDIVSAARRAGYNPSHSDVYLPSVARFPGDPEAFIKHDSARGHIKKTLEARGWSCEGSVKVKGRQSPPKEKKLGDDLALEGARELRLKNPKASARDLREEAKIVHGNKSIKE